MHKKIIIWVVVFCAILSRIQINASSYYALLSMHSHVSTTAGTLVEDNDDKPIQVWLSPKGSDEGDGTESNPFSTLQKALLHVRHLRARLKGHIFPEVQFILKGGTYRLSTPLELTEEDSGVAGSIVVIKAAPGESPVISGGQLLKGWENAKDVLGLPKIAKGNVWSTEIPDDVRQCGLIRQFWVNGTKMHKASTFDDLSLPRIVSVNKEKGELTIPEVVDSFAYPAKLEMTILQDWVMNYMRVKTIKNENGYSYLTFQEPESKIEFKRPWPILRADKHSFSNHMFYLSNAIELLNRPQEWYHDDVNDKLYYWPRSGEEKNTVEAIVPRLETLVKIGGKSTGEAAHIVFRGITFEHTGWQRPSSFGHVPLQAGQYLYDAYTDKSARGENVAWVGRPAAGIEIRNARNICFEDCHFRHMGSTALDFISGVKNVKVRGCVFNDIGGSGILAGYFGDENFEAHLAYNPVDKSDICDSLMIDNTIIVSPASEDWGCLGICVGYASNVIISHNEISDTPYSAISMGWGWTPDKNCMYNNHIIGNYIHHFCTQMRDGGAIYTLSSQPNSSIENNRIEHVGDPLFNPVMWDMRHAQFDIYLDEGSDYLLVKDNWCERGEISRNKNGSHNTWGKNDNTVSLTIKESAGLSPVFQGIKKKVAQPSYAPIDSIKGDKPSKDYLDYIAQNEGFKCGSAIAVDLNCDNLLDIVYSGGESHQVQMSGVRINMGNYDFRGIQGLHRLHMNKFAAGDLNGDGYMDIVQTGKDFWNGYNTIWINDQKGRLLENRLLIPVDASSDCGIADINGDGLCDMFFFGKDNRLYLQKQDRTWDKPKSIHTRCDSISYIYVTYADFDNNQTVDICLFARLTAGEHYACFLSNDGYGNFVETTIPIEECGTIEIADINDDGWLDLAIADEDKGTVTLYLNNKKKGFERCQIITDIILKKSVRPIRFCDLNNDGNVDLIMTGMYCSSVNFPQTSIYLNTGAGRFSKSKDVFPGAYESSIELADFGGLGKIDLMLNGSRPRNSQMGTEESRIAILCTNLFDKDNTPPCPPENLSSKVMPDGDVILKWKEGKGSHSARQSISYNYYVRNMDSGKYLIFPDADVKTGTRWVSRIGNAYLNHGWILHNLPKGHYAWSVQAVNAAYVGSPFSKEHYFRVQ